MTEPFSKTSAQPLDWDEFKAAVAFAMGASDSRLKKGSYRFILFAALSAYTGLPAKEIMQLKWRDVISKTLYIDDDSPCGFLIIPIPPEVQKIAKSLMFLIVGSEYTSIENYYNFLDSSIIPNLTTPSRTEPMSIQYLNLGLKELMRASGCLKAGISTHTFRKTYAKRRFDELGQTPYALVELSKRLKHSSASFTKSYIGV